MEQVRSIAGELLIKKGDDKPVGVNWPQKFLKRHPQIKTVYVPPLDKERAMAQDHDILAGWFNLFQSLKKEHGIEIEDIYNMDEKGFMQGVIAKLRVMIFKYEKKAHMTQCGNREWVSLIECISMDGRVLKPWIIFKGKLQQKAWYEMLKEGHIALSENGWTDNELSLAWIQKCFDPETKIGQKGEYRMLLIDGHASHITTQVIDYCVSQKIILLCLPAHTTHLLQPLDVGVFAPLATAYKTHVQRVTRLGGSYSIDKTDFLELYQLARHEAITPLNIRNAWTATGLLPFSPALVLQHFPPVKELEQSQQYNIVIRPTTPSEATVTYIDSDKGLEVVLTPANTSQVQQLIRQAIEGPTSGQILQKVGKAAIRAMAESTIQDITNLELLELNRRKKQKINRIGGNYGTARVMNQDIVDERRENQRTKVWQKEVNSLLRLGPELFSSTSKPPSTRKRAVVTSAQQTKLWNREVNNLLRLGPELFASKPPLTIKKRAVEASMTASSRQKKKKQLIFKLRVRQLEQKQEQEQKQRNNVISTTGQSGRGMRIRRAPKRSY